jgi:hypothetical protein
VLKDNDGNTDAQFGLSELGIYAADFSNGLRGCAVEALEGTVLVSTAKSKELGYTRAELRQAQRARDLMHQLGFPSVRQLTKIVTNNQLRNCPVTSRDIQAAEAIFGPDVSTLKGKTVRRTPEPVKMRETEMSLCALTSSSSTRFLSCCRSHETSSSAW